MILTRNKTFYKTFLVLFFPLVLHDVINLSVNLADNIMLGHYTNPAALSGATEVNHIQFILQCLVGGLGSGITVLGSQYWGQRRTEPIKRLVAFAFAAGTSLALALLVVCSLFPRNVLMIFNREESIIEEGLIYLSVIKYSYVIFAFTTVLSYALNSVETVKVSFFVSVETLIVNIGLNAILIPRHGSWGAAMATLLARVGALILVATYVAFFDKKLRLKISDLFHFDKVLTWDYVRVSAPMVAVSGLWGCSNALQTVILGNMMPFAVAASSASFTLYSLFKAASQSACNASGIIMAKTVGAGDFGRVKEYARTFQVIFIAIGICSACLLYLAKGPVFSYYNLPGETMDLANQFILVMCVCTVGMAYQMPTISGIIRGGGDTRFCLINDLISIWCIVLPVSALAAFVWKWPPVAVFACLNSDQVFKCGAAAIRCNGYRWVKRLTRDEDGLKQSAV